jgi:hypothetical protein
MVLFIGLTGCKVDNNFLKNPDPIPPIVENEQPIEEQPIEEQPIEEQPIEEEPIGEDPIEEDKIDVNGLFTSKDDVALYIYTYGHLPSNYRTKSQIDGHISDYYTNQNKLSIGGDIFYNREGLLPYKSGRTYYEADINYSGQSSRGAERIVFSDDGLIFYTGDHYDSFTQYNGDSKTWN